MVQGACAYPRVCVYSGYMETKEARDLKVGDVVRINAKCLWIVDSLEFTDKVVNVKYRWSEWSTADWKPDGRSIKSRKHSYRHRLSTKLNVIEGSK